MSDSLSQFPARDTSFQDKSGQITPVWYRFLFGQWKKTGGGTSDATIPEILAAIAGLVVSVAAKVAKAGDTMTGHLTLSGAPTAPLHAATKLYVDTTASTVSPATVAPLVDGVAAVGTSLLYARQDHVHPTNPALATLASPTFTGVPAAPTAAPGTNTTQLATTAYSTAAILVETNRATAAEALLAPKASPALTGVPTAPTAAPGTNTTQVATTAYTTAAVAVETTRATTAEGLLAPIASPSFTGNALVAGGIGVWGHAAPGAQPAAPVTLADVVTLLKAYGLCS